MIIPAFNEESSLPLVLEALPRDRLHEIIVVDNASTDDTARVAREGGARVVHESRRGYGSACLQGIASLTDEVDLVVFLDGDFSDHPDELPRVIEPILEDRADLVIGSRALGEREPGALLPQARWGNLLAVTLIRWLWGGRYTDLGPFRAIRREALDRLGMADRDYGWTVEMQIRAIERGLRVTEVPVSYRCRVGQSKITGTVKGTLLAGWKILTTIARFRLRSWFRGRDSAS